MHYKNLTLIGTSHIAKQSLREIEEAFEREKPDIIAVELDAKRLPALMTEQRGRIGLGAISHIGLKGYLFAVIGGYMQRKLGSMVGMMPGSEMKLAVKLAQKNRLKLALIDRDIEITLKRFSKELTWKEKFRFIADIFKSIFMKKRAMKELGVATIDLSKVPDKELINKLMAQLKTRYPNIYKVLVKERNTVMANNLYKMMLTEPEKKIMAVVGAGHEEEMIEMIKKRFTGKIDVVI
jgi:pheromone shutdown-related protein TraB